MKFNQLFIFVCTLCTVYAIANDKNNNRENSPIADIATIPLPAQFKNLSPEAIQSLNNALMHFGAYINHQYCLKINALNNSAESIKSEFCFGAVHSSLAVSQNLPELYKLMGLMGAILDCEELMRVHYAPDQLHGIRIAFASIIDTFHYSSQTIEEMSGTTQMRRDEYFQKFPANRTKQAFIDRIRILFPDLPQEKAITQNGSLINRICNKFFRPQRSEHLFPNVDKTWFLVNKFKKRLS